jgi:N-acetylglucosaminyl-diphospho-decaprenol L-rhamnosyltransferase
LTVAALYARDALIMPVPGWLRLGVVLYENVPRQLARLVRSMELNAEAPETPRFEVAWFDNSASDAARGVLEGLGQCQYRHSDANVGFGAGHNALMGEAFSAPEVAAYACVNPDAALHPRCVAELWAEAKRQHRVGLVEARQLPEEHPKVYDPVSHRTPWCCGCVMLVTRELYEAIGGFDERMFLYCEDVDLSWRARGAGFGTFVAPRALVHHYADARPQERDPRAWMLASGAYLARKYGHEPIAAQWSAEYRRLRESALEVPEGPAAPPEARAVADFSHAFSFAETRW